jgi:hypothetical protein
MKTLKFETAKNGEILEALQNEGADMTALCETLQTDKSTVAQIIRASAREGCLVWTKQYIVSTHSTCPFVYRF